MQFASSIEVMRIHVGVHDANGAFVSGLGVDDFDVRIDGAPRTLVDALEVSDATRVDESLLPQDPALIPPTELFAAEVPSPRLPSAARRHFLIFFDLSLSNMRSIRYMRESALHFVQNVVLPSDVLGLATYSPRRGLEVPAAFTTNHRRVEEVLAAFGTGRAIEGADPGGTGLDMAARTAVATDDIRERFEPLNGTFSLAAMEAFEAAGGATRMVRSAEDMLRGLRLLVDAMAPEQGRKHLLFFSNGLPNEVFTRGQFRDEANDTIAAAIGTDTVVHAFSPDAVNVSNFDDASSTVIGANDDARTWDPLEGLGSQYRDRDVMRFLPDETGGTTTFYQANLDAGLATVESATRSFYVLAFRMTGDDADRVNVEVATSRDGVEVAWAPSELELMSSGSQRTPLQSRLELASALESASDRADIRMDVRAFPISVRNGFGRAALVAQIDARELDQLRAQRGDGKLEFELIGQAIDARGDVRDFFRTRADSNVENRDGDLPFRYYNTVVVPPGRYHIRLVVQELGTGHIASRRLQFDVPEAPAVALRMSGPVIVRGGDGIVNGVQFGEQPAHRASLPVTYPFQIMGRDLTPDLTSVLTAGQRIELFALVYDLTAPDPDADPRAGLDVALRNRAGDLVFIERFGGVVWERSPEDGAMRLGLQLWLPDDLPSGTWELVVQATDLATYHSTDAGVAITVLSAAS